MRTTLTTLIALIFIGFSASAQQTAKNDIEGFNKFLGKEKANALNAAEKSFEQFLLTNYANHNSFAERTKAFLKQLSRHNKPDSLWALDTEKNSRIIESFETTGLRKEIWLYGYEEYSPKNNIYELLPPEEKDTSNISDLGELEIDLIEEELIPISKVDPAELAKRDREREERMKNSLHANAYGEFLYGLAKFTPNDSLIQGYVKVKVTENDISPGVIAGGFLEYYTNLDDPFMKRIMVVEFYFWIMKWDIERKG